MLIVGFTTLRAFDLIFKVSILPFPPLDHDPSDEFGQI
jgi:hypothetical protein